MATSSTYPSCATSLVSYFTLSLLMYLQSSVIEVAYMSAQRLVLTVTVKCLLEG